MNQNIISKSVFCISILLINLNQLSSQACSPGNLYETTYQRRDNNRCEGIKPYIQVNGGISLISLMVLSIPQKLDKTIQLQLPRLDGFGDPVVKVEVPSKDYILNDLNFHRERSHFTFTWSTNILNKEKIHVEDLRAIAFANQGSQKVYLPVTIGKSSGKYKFVLRSNSDLTAIKFQIRSVKGQVVYEHDYASYPSGEIPFIWNGYKKDKTTATPGRYELKISAEEEQDDRQPEPVEINVQFEYYPN